MKAKTIEELYKALKAEVDKGNGSRKILLTDDEECNGFHYCWGELLPAEKVAEWGETSWGAGYIEDNLRDGETLDDYIVLG